MSPTDQAKQRSSTKSPPKGQLAAARASHQARHTRTEKQLETLEVGHPSARAGEFRAVQLKQQQIKDQVREGQERRQKKKEARAKAEHAKSMSQNNRLATETPLRVEITAAEHERFNSIDVLNEEKPILFESIEEPMARARDPKNSTAFLTLGNQSQESKLAPIDGKGRRHGTLPDLWRQAKARKNPAAAQRSHKFIRDQHQLKLKASPRLREGVNVAMFPLPQQPKPHAQSTQQNFSLEPSQHLGQQKVTINLSQPRHVALMPKSIVRTGQLVETTPYAHPRDSQRPDNLGNRKDNKVVGEKSRSSDDGVSSSQSLGENQSSATAVLQGLGEHQFQAKMSGDLVLQ